MNEEAEFGFLLESHRGGTITDAGRRRIQEIVQEQPRLMHIAVRAEVEIICEEDCHLCGYPELCVSEIDLSRWCSCGKFIALVLAVIATIWIVV